ncbi:MAG: hypothetical protein [Bacteriophage sp.]|nr:MAG: hypothetical protein [Bacteriophage sp.]
MATQIQTQKVNSTTMVNNQNSYVKQENGFCILASMNNPSSNIYVWDYMAISFDSVPSVGLKRTANITSYPVEDGADISDHVQIKNRTFTLSGYISETPIRQDPVQDLLYSSGVNGTRVAQAIQYLDKIMDSRQTILLVLEQQIYDNVILKGISVDFKEEYGQTFNLDFEQVRIVSNKSVNVIATKTQAAKVTGTTNKTAAPSANLTQSVQSIAGGNNNG